MPIALAQKAALEEVISALLAVTTSRGKRQLCGMFMDLVDRNEWPEYYEIIPEPRCINNIHAGVEKGRYKDPTDVFTDLSLVFWNALFYNEPGSHIAADAETLKNVLETEWKKRPALPATRSSPPPGSAQKVHKNLVQAMSSTKQETTSTAAPSPAPAVPVPPKPSAPAPPRPSAPPIPAFTSANPARISTPSAQTLAVPTASTSYSYNKPVPIRPRSAQRLPTPDMDVDIISQEADGQGDDSGGGAWMDRDPESEEIVKQLEKGLPRWPGFGEHGWMDEVNPDRFIEIVHTIKSHKDIIGNRLSVALESVPEESRIPHLSYTTPLSLKLIESRARAKGYASAKEFDMEMARLFEKARRWHDPGTEAYGRVLLLQRLYQALASANPPLGPPYHSPTNFASLRAGPGTTKPVHGPDGEGVSGVTTHRVLTKDRTFVDELHYKGWSVKLADWLHLSNPDDPSRPIIGQVFRCWISDESTKKGQAGVTVSWYYRPEQTFHASNRKFWEGEVFKTSHFADHPLEDIIEKIACQFTARHIRGRPRPPFWYLGFPLYVCDSRYNDRDRVFVKIKNWNSCVPEEVRKSDEFMPIYPFEKTVFPNRLPSPFLAKGPKGSTKGPGGILHVAEPAHGDSGDDTYSAKKRVKRTGDAGPNRGLYVGATAQGAPAMLAPGQYQYHVPGYPQQSQIQRPIGPDRSIITAAGGAAVFGANAQVEKLPAEITKYFDRDPDTNEVLWFAAPPVNVARPHKAKHSLAYLHFLATKRKQEESSGDMDVDGGPNHAKRSRIHVAPTVTDTMRAVVKKVSDGG